MPTSRAIVKRGDGTLYLSANSITIKVTILRIVWEVLL